MIGHWLRTVVENSDQITSIRLQALADAQIGIVIFNETLTDGSRSKTAVDLIIWLCFVWLESEALL